MAVKILVFGHSFVRRLETFCREQEQHNLNLDLEKFSVVFCGIGGLCLEKAKSHLDNAIRRISPDIVIFDIGSNDLDRTSNKGHDIRFVAADVVEFANETLWKTRLVYVLPAYHRSNTQLDIYEDLLPTFNDN
jgi:hypothetical protein